MNSIFQQGNITVDMLWAIATGAVSDGTQSVGRSVGYVAAPTLNTIAVVRGSIYVPQATAAQRSFKSSSVSDTASGIGAQTILINYLDGNMNLQTEIVTLNGTTAVNMVSTTVQFVESITVLTCGSNLANVGTISMFTSTGGSGSTMATMNVGDNATFWGQHYVPAGYTCYISKHTGAATLAAGRTYMVTYGDPRSNNPIQQVGDIIIHLAGGTEDHEYDVPLTVVGPNLIVLRENPVVSVANNEAYASFDWVQDI